MSKTTNKFSAEVRERAVRLVLDHEKDHPSRWAAVCMPTVSAALQGMFDLGMFVWRVIARTQTSSKVITRVKTDTER